VVELLIVKGAVPNYRDDYVSINYFWS